MTSGKLDRKVNILSIYAFLSSVTIIYLLFVTVGRSDTSQSIDELTVKRINVVSENDSLRMVISNETRQHNGIVDGIELPPREGNKVLSFLTLKAMNAVDLYMMVTKRSPAWCCQLTSLETTRLCSFSIWKIQK